MRYVLDTHALLWHLSNDARLGANAKRILDDPNTPLIVPVLVLAEAKHAADRKRTPIAFEHVLQAVLASPRLTVFPMDLYTVHYLSSQLDIHDSSSSPQHYSAKNSFETRSRFSLTTAPSPSPLSSPQSGKSI